MTRHDVPQQREKRCIRDYCDDLSSAILVLAVICLLLATEQCGCSTVAAFGIIPCNHGRYHHQHSSWSFVKGKSLRNCHFTDFLYSSFLSSSSSYVEPHLEQEQKRRSPLPSLPLGSSQDMYVIQQYTIPFEFENLTSTINIHPDKCQRLEITSQNVTLPIALMLWNSTEYPTLSRARKACRKGKIVLRRRQQQQQQQCSDDTITKSPPDDQDMTKFADRGKVGDRVYPGDRIGIQQRLSPQQYSNLLSCRVDTPTIHIPVIYQDDYFAIVQKPAGIPMYEPGGGGRQNVRFALPYILTPPSERTITVKEVPPPQDDGKNENDDYVLSRPETCHRLDKPTSGLLVVAKTKSAIQYLSKQFENRLVQKTYTAIVDGRLPTNNISSSWQLAETMLDDKKATTRWKSLNHFPSLQATNQTLTLVQLKPQTGRYHQLRRQMAWMYNCPIVGDTTYRNPDKELPNKRWKRGLMLCSNRISIQHPYYNTPLGKIQWETLPTTPHQDHTDNEDDDGNRSNKIIKIKHQNSDGSFSYVHESESDGSVWVTAEIQIPNKFEKYLRGESNRYHYADIDDKDNGN